MEYRGHIGAGAGGFRAGLTGRGQLLNFTSRVTWMSEMKTTPECSL